MHFATALMDERIAADWESEIRPLVEELREAFDAMMEAGGTEIISHFLEIAPHDVCVKLSDLWANAESSGLHIDRLKNRFDLEEQFLIELVVDFYHPIRPGTSSGLSSLLDDETFLTCGLA